MPQRDTKATLLWLKGGPALFQTMLTEFMEQFSVQPESLIFSIEGNNGQYSARNEFCAGKILSPARRALLALKVARSHIVLSCADNTAPMLELMDELEKQLAAEEED